MKYQYKKKKKSNIDVRETFDFIKKAIAAKYDEENFEKYSESGTDADTSDEEQKDIILQLKKNNLLCLVKIKVY